MDRKAQSPFTAVKQHQSFMVCRVSIRSPAASMAARTSAYRFSSTPEQMTTVSARMKRGKTAAIGMINSKTTAVRVIPAVGKKPGEEVSYGGLFGTAPIMEVNTASPAKFIHRGGRIPAPIQSLKN